MGLVVNLRIIMRPQRIGLFFVAQLLLGRMIELLGTPFGHAGEESLDEVLNEGNADQKQEATRLLESIR